MYSTDLLCDVTIPIRQGPVLFISHSTVFDIPQAAKMWCLPYELGSHAHNMFGRRVTTVATTVVSWKYLQL